MKLLTITLVSALALDITAANLELKLILIKEFNKLTATERKVLLEFYKMNSITEFVNKFNFITDKDIRKLYSDYKENGYGDLSSGLTYKQFKKELSLLGYNKGQFNLHDYDHNQISLMMIKFVLNKSDMIKNIHLHVSESEFIKAKGQRIFDEFNASGKIILMELK